MDPLLQIVRDRRNLENIDKMIDKESRYFVNPFHKLVDLVRVTSVIKM